MYDLCKGKNICEGGDEMDIQKEGMDEANSGVSLYIFFQCLGTNFREKKV